MGPTTTDVHVLVGSSAVYNNEVTGYGPPSSVSYSSLELSILSGQTIDFAVGEGIDGGYYFDTTGIAATITSVPVPPTVLLLGSGLMGLGLLRFRRKA